MLFIYDGCGDCKNKILLNVSYGTCNACNPDTCKTTKKIILNVVRII